MSNKHYIKGMKRRLRKRQGAGQLTSIKELYDVARAAELRQKQERKRQTEAAYRARSEQMAGAPDPVSEMARLISQDQRRKARVSES